MQADSNLYATLKATASRHGQREAFVGPGERLSWSQMQEGAQRIARALHALGIRKGDHVGLFFGNCGTWEQTFFACAALGAVTVPINTRFKREELEFCLRQADIKLLFFVDQFLGIDFVDLVASAEPALTAGLPGAALPILQHAVMLGKWPCPAGALRFDDFVARAESVRPEEVDSAAAQVSADDLLLIQFTSGTTSFPKGAMLTHGNMLRNAKAAAKRMGVRCDDRYFSIRPFYHVAGSTLSILVSISTGCCLLTLPKFDVAEALRMLETEQCTLTSGNDTIFLMLMGFPDFDATKLHLRGGWAAAGPEVMQKIRDTMHVPSMCNAYGLSEASPNVVLSSWNDPFPLRAAGWARPHPGIDLRIVDPQSGSTLPAGSHGEIQVRGWSVMRGYYKMPEATAQAITPDGWLRTGDLGEMNAEGRLRMVGRLKDMYRVGGENVAPAEVEEVLHAHPAVKQAQVVGVPDPRLGEVTAAFVLLKHDAAVSPQELMEWCRPRCANFKVPAYVQIVDSFENIGMTASSKVQKNKLRQHAIELFGLRR